MSGRTSEAVTALWRKDDWLSVWIAFGILAVFIAGFALKMPDWKWMSRGEFAARTAAWMARASTTEPDARAAGAAGLADALGGLAAALQAGTREDAARAASAAASAAGADAVKDTTAGKAAAALAADVRTAAGQTVGRVLSWANLGGLLVVLAGFMGLSLAAAALMREKVLPMLASFPVLFVLGAASFLVAGNASVSYWGLEYVIWALALGLFISNVFGVPAWLKAASKTELYVKTGLVLLGAEVIFSTIARAGGLAMIQAVLVIAAVWYACYGIARWLGLDREFGAILSTGVSVCGVSAAIAAGGALKGDPKKVSHTISLVLLMAVPMLVLEPLVARLVGMPAAVTGAWLGGTIDTTGAVAAAGALAGPKALSVATVVKLAQNALIGLIAFFLALWASFRGNGGPDRPRALEIWNRFPKFVLGFIVASVVFSFLLAEPAAKSVTKVTAGLRAWWFALAFLSIGLDTRIKDLLAMGGGKPALTFVLAQLFNIGWTLLIAWLIFGGVLFPVPAL